MSETSKHSLAVRILHWANFVVIALLVWTAFLLLSGSPELRWSHWFPQNFYSALNLDNRNDEGRVWHVLFSFVMMGIGLLYALNLALSGQWKALLPAASSWRDAYFVVLHDLGLSTHRPAQGKYNGAQRLAYTAVVLMALGEIITGLPIYFRAWTGVANALGGQTAIRFEHFILMLGILAFVVVHVVQVVRAGWSNFRPMVAGTSRRTFAALTLAGVILALLGAFAHSQSNASDRVPGWLNWARDVEQK